MGVITYEHEVPSSIPPARLFKSFILDADNLIPKVLPGPLRVSKSLRETAELAPSRSQYKSAKHRIDGIDEENHIFKYSVIEGDVLGDALDSISYVVKVEAGPHGGSVCKTTSIYHTKKDDHHITEDLIKAGKEKAKAIFKAVEDHLHAHPHDYNH
ncbi:hypothetical protein DH2020_040810 [Rehmannia glutinosa]|uniref:Bet v I/Major latex protein domain-containing protein n=1 Tax=Rehmannia glutinosa TaxID=99300 RepID=A0ABR0URY3_REHGL